MKLSLGPVLFYWTREKLLNFYAEMLEHVEPVLRRVARLRFSSLTGGGSLAQHAEIIARARAGLAEEAGRASRENWLSLRYTFDEPASDNPTPTQ